MTANTYADGAEQGLVENHSYIVDSMLDFSSSGEDIPKLVKLKNACGK
jgi:hypothetical protein